MQLRHIVFKELQQRRVRLIIGFLVIFLAITVIVAIQSVTVSSRVAVAKQLRRLGPNMFVLPRSLSLSDFYTANYGDSQMPESYIYRLRGAELEGVEGVKGMLSIPIKLNNNSAIVTGILSNKTMLIDQNEVFLGSEIAKLLNLKQGILLSIKGQEFKVTKVLPEKGTIDDVRVYLFLTVAQKIFKKKKVINVIEIVSSMPKNIERLTEEIEALLPGTKVVSKRRIAQAQARTMAALKKYSLILLIIIVFIGGLSITNYMYINVRERRKEIGTLMAMGATPGLILKVFLQKAILLGVGGGIGGYIFGTLLAIILGSQIVKVPVKPLPGWFIWSIIIAVIFSLCSSVIPAKVAANLDPARILQEE